MSDKDHVRQHIELAIERAREGVAERIDELDVRLRENLDFKKMAGENAPQLLAIGAGLGFLFGFGVPRLVIRAAQIGVPIAIAVSVAKKKLAEHDQGSDPSI